VADAQLITKKAVAIAELISDRKLDVLAFTETGHRAADDVCLRTAIPPGLAVAEAAHKNRTGGVAVIYRSQYQHGHSVFRDV